MYIYPRMETPVIQTPIQARLISHRGADKVGLGTGYPAGITHRVTPHVLRHCFATHLLDNGTSIPFIYELLGHKVFKTTFINSPLITNILDTYISPLDQVSLSDHDWKKIAEFKNSCTFAPTVPVQHTVRSASGSFFFYSYGE